jgi:hypothetical protein
MISIKYVLLLSLDIRLIEVYAMQVVVASEITGLLTLGIMARQSLEVCYK